MRKGFSLLEVLITLLLFSAGVVAISGLFSSAMSVGSDAESTAIASNLVQERLEELRNKDYLSVMTEAKAVVPGYPLYQRQVTATESPTDLKRVKVSVYWMAPGGEAFVFAETYVSKN
jgi:prepilin-type N-terminal cleavage/methylation domain-containing protein